jgi:hypothetical protein
MKLAALALVALGGTARADAPVVRPEAIDVDRDTTPPGQAELSFDGGAPIGTWALGVTLGFLERPVRFHTLVSQTYPVDHRETAVLGGALALGDRVIVDARIPLSHQVGSRLEGLGDEHALDRWVAGDLELGARVDVATTKHVGVFVRGVLTLPTGNDNEFAGDARWSAAWLGIARVTLAHDIVIAGTAGIHIRGGEVLVENELVGDELVWGIGATAGIPPLAHLWCRPDQLRGALELDGVVGDRETGYSHGPSPAEVKLGVIGRIRPEYAIAVRIGTQLDDQLGAPLFRATVDLVYQADPSRKRPEPAPSRSHDAEDEDDE